MARNDKGQYKNSENTNLALMAQDIGYIKTDIVEINHKIDSKFVTTDQLKPWTDKVNLHNKILFAIIGTVGLTVLGAILSLVILR